MFLAVDAGGTSTRAVLLDASGRASGYGRSGVGNPTAAGIRQAVKGIGSAAEQAIAHVAVSERPVLALIAMAGEKTPAFRKQVVSRLAALGVRQVVLEHDLLGIFHSGTAALDGYALIAGTGTVAARIREGRLDRVVGGKGWLLGDAGGGFWIGHAVARAVVASLDGPGAGHCADWPRSQGDRDRGRHHHSRGMSRGAAAVGFRLVCPAAHLVGRVRATRLRGPRGSCRSPYSRRRVCSARGPAFCSAGTGSVRPGCGRRQHHCPRHAGCASQPAGRPCPPAGGDPGDSGFGRHRGRGSAGFAARRSRR